MCSTQARREEFESSEGEREPLWMSRRMRIGERSSLPSAEVLVVAVADACPSWPVAESLGAHLLPVALGDRGLDGTLARQRHVAPHDHVAVARLDLETEGSATEACGCDQSRAATEERIKDDLA